MAYRISPSSLNLLAECPKCFWLYVVKRAKRPSGPFPSLPSGMDAILKKHFDSFMEKGELPPELREEACVEGCKLFDDREKLREWRNNWKGLQYKDNETGVELHGAVDNILVKQGKLIVLDYKTRGYPLKADTHKHYQLQMDLYNFLLKKNGHKTESHAFLLFYYPNKVTKTGEVEFDTKLVKMPVHPKNGEKKFKKAINVLKEKKPPKSSRECEYCKYRNGE